jgi:hypothetical protein
VIADSGFHRWRDAERLMNFAEVVIREVQRDVVGVHFDFLAEPVGQAREPAHVHPHREVLALDVAGRNVARCAATIRSAA